jgi:hypothetical protein
LWAANDIKPHLSRTFKLSNDKQFEAKFWDVIGLYGVAGGVTAFTNTIRTAAAGNDGLRPATGGVVQPGKALDGEAPTPFVDRHRRHAKPAGDPPLWSRTEIVIARVRRCSSCLSPGSSAILLRTIDPSQSGPPNRCRTHAILCIYL